MSFFSQPKRKIKVVSHEDADVLSVNLGDKVIVAGPRYANFERLYYKGCPSLVHNGTKSNNKLIDMSRRPLVVRIHKTVFEMDRTDRSKVNIFQELQKYIKFLDDEGVVEIFTRYSLELYVEYLAELYRAGRAKGKSLSQRQSVLKTFIREFDPNLARDCDRIYYDFPHDSVPVEPYTDGELKNIYQALSKIYNVYSKSLFNNEVPRCFPLYDLDTTEGKTYRYVGFYNEVSVPVIGNNNVDLWKSDLTKSAFYIMCLYTGVNATPLLEIRLEDVVNNPFDKVSSGNYVLKTIKRRQSGRSNYIDVGFSKRAKSFFESWINVSKTLNGGDAGYLFPNIVRGDVREMNNQDASTLNRAFKEFNLPNLSSQRFRKTKASLLMRATESVTSVAEGLTNDPETAARYYTNGNADSMVRTLASALDVRQRTAQGQQFGDAVSNRKFKLRDPVREAVFLKDNSSSGSVLNGLRCSNPYGEKSEALKSSLIKAKLANKIEKVACHKFFECFRCEYHAVIAEPQDVWMLLSFKDVLIQAGSRPSINSLPSEDLSKVINTIEDIVSRITEKFPSVYSKAYDYYLDGPHPLWSDAGDLDLIGSLY